MHQGLWTLRKWTQAFLVQFQTWPTTVHVQCTMYNVHGTQCTGCSEIKCWCLDINIKILMFKMYTVLNNNRLYAWCMVAAWFWNRLTLFCYTFLGISRLWPLFIFDNLAYQRQQCLKDSFAKWKFLLIVLSFSINFIFHGNNTLQKV